MKLVNRMKKTTNKNTNTIAPVAAKLAAPSKTVTPFLIVPTQEAKPVIKSEKAAPTPKSPIVTSTAPIVIEAKIDIGYGNNLFVRGQGAGLSWDRGVQLKNVDQKTWRIAIPASDKLQFKLLLNDTVWAQGEDLVATPGKPVQVVPAF